MKRSDKAAKNIKKRFAEIGDLPREIITEYSKMTLWGNEEFTIENYCGIIEYEMNKIRLGTKSGVICVNGESLTINELDNDGLLVKGRIKSIEMEE